MQVQNIIDLENALIVVFKGAAFFHYTILMNSKPTESKRLN